MAVFTALAIGGLGGIALAATGTAIYAGAYGIDQTIKSSKKAGAAARSARSASEIQIKQQKENAKQARRSAVRSSIIARSQGTVGAQASGTQSSSGFLGGMSSLASQLGSNLGFGSMMSGLGENYTAMSGLASQQSAESAMYGAKANLGFKVMNFAMKGAEMPTFGGGKTKTSGGSPPNYDYGRGGQQ
tara:strand:- start:6629 stop:7192 length:564 start_codon:yes stop_codon:yes gene_type:complete